MPESIARRAAQLLTLLVPGLFAGRVLSEIIRPTPIAAAMITALAAFGGAYLLYRLAGARPFWLGVPLFAYIFFPDLRPDYALAAAAASALAAIFLYGDRLPRRIAAPAPRLLALLILVCAFALYAWTVAPGLLPADSGELQLVAARLGIAHPPGFALYTLLAHIATRLPVGPGAAYRANLLSALIAAVTLAIVFLSAFRLTHSRRAGIVAVVALATAPTFWSQATTANVRMLAAFFTALALYLLLRYRQHTIARPAESVAGRGSRYGSRSLRSSGPILFRLALTLSLGVTHHASLLFMSLVFALSLIWLDLSLLRRPLRWLWLFGGLLLGLLPLLYFPLRALTISAPVRGVNPEIATMPGFLQHVLALGFRGDLFAFAAPHELWARLGVMGNVMAFQFHWLLLAGMLLGLLLLLRAQPSMAFALGGAFALHTLVTATYRAPQTVEYMLPAYIPAALLLAVCSAPPLTYRAVPARVARHLSAVLAAALLVTSVLQGIRRYSNFELLSNDHTALEYATNIVEQAPRDSVVLAGWHWATPLWYLQEVEGKRPDLSIHYVFPTAVPYGETWARRIAENLDQDHPVVATHFDSAAFATLPPAGPLGDAFLFPHEPRSALPEQFTPLEQTLGNHVELLGYRLAHEQLAPLEETTLTIAWRPLTADPAPAVTLFVHVVNPSDNVIYAQSDIAARPFTSGITLTRLYITPRLATAPGDYHVYVGAYDSASGEPLPGAEGETRLLVGSIAIQPMSRPPYTAHPIAVAAGADQRQLIGYDWDDTLAPRTRLYLHWRTPGGYVTEALDDPPPLARRPAFYGPWGLLRRPQEPAATAPQYYVPLGAGIVWTGAPQLGGRTPPAGSTLTLAQQFTASRPLQQDLVVSVRLVGYEPDGVHWAWWDLHDTVPALGAIPTLKWIETSRVRDPHFLTVSPAAPSGQTLGALLSLYDAFTQRPLPILDKRITSQYLGIPLGTGQVR